MEGNWWSKCLYIGSIILLPIQRVWKSLRNLLRPYCFLTWKFFFFFFCFSTAGFTAFSTMHNVKVFPYIEMGAEKSIFPNNSI